MKRTILCLSILLALFALDGSAQEQSCQYNRFDADLYNGTIYNFGSAHIRGHQFLEKEMFDTGSITIDKQSFSGLLLNYDIFNQEVLLKSGKGFQEKIISLPVETIKSFSIGDRHFIVAFEENRSAIIYETIGDLNFKFIRSWSKEMKTVNDNSIYNYEFSKPLHDTYFSNGEYMQQLRWRKDVLEVFPETNRSDVKKFLRKNKIRFRSASSAELLELIRYRYTLK
jgi:hypothetical protein